MGATMVLAIGFWLAFFGARLIRTKGIPELVAFLIVGALIGPHGFGLVNRDLLEGLKPVVAIATAMLMFGIGERLSPRELRVSPFSAPAGMFSALLTAVIVAPLSLLAGANGAEAMMLAVLASAGAPMTLTALSAKVRSPYSTGLIGAHAVSDAVAAIAFSLALPIALMLVRRSSSIGDAVGFFLRLGPGSVALGVVVGLVVARFSRNSAGVGESMVLVMVHMVVLSAIAAAAGASIPLAALVSGTVVATRVHGEKHTFIFKSVQQIEEPLFLAFFTIAGASLDVGLLPDLGLLGVIYILGRTAGKILGGFLGGIIAGQKRNDALRLGTDLLPQAGSAVALVVILTEEIPAEGAQIAAVVLGAIVIFESIAPIFTARNLKRHAVPSAEVSAVPPSHNQPDAPSTVTADYPKPQVKGID